MGINQVITSSTSYGVGIDWLRVKGLSHDFGFHPLDENLLQFIGRWSSEERRHNSLKPWRLREYSGWSLGRWSFGIRGYEVMMEWRSELAPLGLELTKDMDVHCTRIDIKHDFSLEKDDPRFSKLAYDRVQAARQAKTRGYPRKPPIEHIGDGGCSMDAYSREGSLFVRCYDKSSEQGWEVGDGIPRIWRAELEIKQERAEYAYNKIVQGEDKQAVSAAIARSLLLGCGLSILFPWGGTTASLPVSARKETDDERSLAWLERSVQGTVRKLIDKGRIDATMRALGIIDALRQ